MGTTQKARRTKQKGGAPADKRAKLAGNDTPLNRAKKILEELEELVRSPRVLTPAELVGLTDLLEKSDRALREAGLVPLPSTGPRGRP